MKLDAANSKSIDLLNVGLIVLSLIIAFKIPFELFLFSYAVLGPLHYLTEINWLQDRNYFIKEKRWVWVFVFLAVLITIPVLLKIPAVGGKTGQEILTQFFKWNRDVFFSVFFISFLFAITLVYVKKWQYIVAALIINILGTFAILKYKLFSIAFLGMFLPTIMHVYLFTWLFMIYGTLKSRNAAGLVGCLLLAVVPFVIAGSSVNIEDFRITEGVKGAFLKSDFQNVNGYIASLVGGLSPDGKFYLVSEAGIKIQVFIAFCYTYHYLNWFSKTSIIGWSKNVSRQKVAIIAGVWIAAIALYLYDYKIGFAALFTLSLVHVFFEFPLNVVSAQGIFFSIVGKDKPGK